MMTSGCFGRALIRLICPAIEASSFLNVSSPAMLAPSSVGNIQSKPLQMPLSYSIEVSSRV